jgi:hypothetical protein
MDGTRLFWGLIVLILGITFVCINVGIVGISVLWSILAMWPIILVALGLKLLIKNEILFSILILLLVLGTVVFVGLNYEYSLVNPRWDNLHDIKFMME